MGSESRQLLHVFFLPLMAPGHMIPMVDIAKLFSSRGAKSTIVTTLANAPRIQSAAAADVDLLLLPFHLHQGCENLTSLPSQLEQIDFIMSCNETLPIPFRRLVADHRPDAIVTDVFFPWTAGIAEEFGIPRLVFHGTNFFSLCAMDSLYKHNPHNDVSGDSDHFVLPGLPHLIKMARSQIPDVRQLRADFVDLFGEMNRSELSSYGVVVNSVYEMEPDYVEHYKKVMGRRRAWHVGPVSLCNKNASDKAARGGDCNCNTAATRRCMEWLDSKKPCSVVYVSFGSLSSFTAAQKREIALGIKASGHPFIWVVRGCGGCAEEEWLPKEVEDKGLIIRGWAPQILILNHKSVGGFVTHCGWNSTLEGIAAGLPMATWPLFDEQFYNERFIVDVLKVGIAVGAKHYALRAEDRVVVKAEDVGRAVARLMGGGEEMEEVRRRAREVGKMARRAMEEGGSSCKGMDRLIEKLMAAKVRRGG